MFYHHILKPERVPLEANLWGTPKSSGSFSTLFESRVLRALDYADDPFELCLTEKNGKPASMKVFGLCEPIGRAIATDAAAFVAGEKVYVSCGDSGRTDLPDGSVDAVISDPPFFDNVHYSELADFFHVWQRHVLGENGPRAAHTTRHAAEVQNADASTFTERLCAVWRECHRLLKDDGLLVFTYHHSRGEGWASILKAVMDAGFAIVAAHPIKSEMSVATPKHQANEPIDLDIIMVCRKRLLEGGKSNFADPWWPVEKMAEHQVARLRATDRRLSKNDILIIVMAQLLRELSHRSSLLDATRFLKGAATSIEAVLGRLTGSIGV